MHIPNDVARLCHEVNRAYCAAIGDNTQVSWDEAPEWQKKSAINGVQFAIANAATPEEMHESWMKQKLRDGWKYGPVKDAANLEHPCIVPYHMLPAEQKAKDVLFRAVVRTVLAIEGETLGDGVAGDRAPVEGVRMREFP